MVLLKLGKNFLSTFSSTSFSTVTLDIFKKIGLASIQFSTLCPESIALSRLKLITDNPLIIPSCGMKVKGTLKLRCKDCYFERKDGHLYISCSSYPRHKQKALGKKEKYTWILTHCMQSKRRPY